MSDRLPKPGEIAFAPDQSAGDQESFVPRRLTSSQLLGPGRMDGVNAERAGAVAQIQRTMKVWRKAAGGDDSKAEAAEVSQPGEPAEKEADTVADEVAEGLHGSKDKRAKDEERESAAGEEKAPKIGAKLDGIARKIFRDARNRAEHEQYKTELRREMAKPATKDPELTAEMDKLYRPGAKVGSGSTAAAIREEKATGAKIGGKEHTQKGQDAIVKLGRWLKAHPKADAGDIAAAENVIKDLQDALK